MSTFEDRPSKMDDRCADLRRSKTDDRCEIMLLHLLKTLMVYLYANNCTEGLHFSAFISVARHTPQTEEIINFSQLLVACILHWLHVRMR